MSKKDEALKLARDLTEFAQRFEDGDWSEAINVTHQEIKLLKAAAQALAEQPPCKYPHCAYPCPDLPDCRDAEQPASKLLTDEQITAGARALCKQMAEACGVDVRDQWQLYADTFKEDAKAVLEAANNAKGNT